LTLDIPGSNDYAIEGSFWGHEFSFMRNNREVATISKKLFTFRDSYSVDIKENENHAEILMTCIVIDEILHDGSGSQFIPPFLEKYKFLLLHIHSYK